ncbi:1-acylglycerol-3-phosphate O-acyltransferase [Aureococcus anophagefferens]|nr:1-acylglycerol-3-phosphate O-acyltransferase [Aureococcus anophagefferens]
MGAPEPTLWSSLPRVGWADADHFSVLSGGAFSDLESIPEPVGVQEVYIMDNFMRALAEFRSPQRGARPLEHVKRRLFEQVAANFAALQRLPAAALADRYGADARLGEADLKWCVYQRYADFLDPDMWKLYGPDSAPEELFDELKVKRASAAIAKFQASAGLGEVQPGAAPSTSKDAIYLLPTHVRVMLWRDGYEMLMYTLPRNATFEALKALVEADVGEAGCFTSFAFGPPGRKFGPGKALEDCVGATTVGVSRAGARALPYISKIEILRIPFIGWAMGFAGHIALRRADRRSQLESYKAAVASLKDGNSLVAFAEGTRSDDGTLKKFKRGPFKMAIDAGVDIVPIALCDLHKSSPA